MSNSNTKHPELYQPIVAILKFQDIGPVAVIGYAAELPESKQTVFVPHCGRDMYTWEIVVKWDYLDEVLPQYSLTGKTKLKQEKHKK